MERSENQLCVYSVIFLLRITARTQLPLGGLWENRQEIMWRHCGFLLLCAGEGKASKSQWVQSYWEAHIHEVKGYEWTAGQSYSPPGRLVRRQRLWELAWGWRNSRKVKSSGEWLTKALIFDQISENLASLQEDANLQEILLPIFLQRPERR